MTSEEFIRNLKTSVTNSAAKETIRWLEGSPGRHVNPDHLELSRWFNSLASSDRKMVARIADSAADLATYNFLAMLDGLKAFEEVGPKGALELYYRTSDGKSRTKLNDENAEELTVLYKDID